MMNILFSGIGGPTPLGLAQSVKMAFPDCRCIGVDGSPWSASLYHSDIFDATYQIVSGKAANYWEVISEVVEKEAIDFAFIVPETEVLVWSQRQEESVLPCKALIPEFKLASFCFDKLKVAEVLYPLELSPATVAFDSSATENQSAPPMAYPFWIRVKSGAGALGALKIESEKDLNTWLSLHDYRQDFIISEYLPGRNYACKLLFLGGELIQHASAERIDYLLSAAAPSGISGMCARGRLLNRPDLVEKSTAALHEISTKLDVQLNGMFTVDFKENLQGMPLITEINIRHVSFNHAFALGGVNFAETTLRHLLNLAPGAAPSNHFEKESFFIRGVDAPLRLIPENKSKPIL